jgi:hypothetical protein
MVKYAGIVSLLLLSFMTTAGADSYSCKREASEELQRCLRTAAENRVGDGNCNAAYRLEIARCNKLPR